MLETEVIQTSALNRHRILSYDCSNFRRMSGKIML